MTSAELENTRFCSGPAVWTHALWRGCTRFLTACVTRPAKKRDRQGAFRDEEELPGNIKGPTENLDMVLVLTGGVELNRNQPRHITASGHFGRNYTAES